jgi:SPP1 gp7 family putative phage head morphogenesis protein
MPTANQEAFDRGLRHAIHLQRLRAHEVNEIVGFLNDEVLPDATATLRRRLERFKARGFDVGPRTTQRVKDAINATSGVIAGGMREVGGALREDLKAVTLTEAEWQRRALDASLPAGLKELGVDFELPTVGQLNSILTSRPFEGDVLSGWWRKVGRSARADISQQVQIGIAQGETNQQIVRRLVGTRAGRYMDGAFGKLRRNVSSTVQTATSHVSAQAREMTYAANDDIVKGVEIVATLDSRTTEICMSEDGKVYPVGEGPRPPFHFNCRTTTTPVLKSWKELGLKDPADIVPPGTRASVNGQVPARTTYGQWLKRQPRAVQEDALGVKKARLFRSGRVTVDKFVDDKRRVLTLDELREVEGLSK